MATAKGKITTARLTPGKRIMVTPGREGTWFPSYTKRKNAYEATVTSVTPVKVGRSTGRRIRATVRHLPDPIVMEVGASQTFWLATS